MTAPADARRRFAARIQALDETGALAEAALWIAAEEYPDLDVSVWLARLAARLGDASAAIRDWETYLRQRSDAPDAETVRQRLRVLRQALGALN